VGALCRRAAAEDCLHNINMDYAQVDRLYASSCHGCSLVGNVWRDLAQETTLVSVVYGQPQIVWASRPRQGAVVIRSNDGG